MTHESLLVTSLHLSKHTNVILVIMCSSVHRDLDGCLTEINPYGQMTKRFTKHENKFSLSRPVSSVQGWIFNYATAFDPCDQL